MTNILFISEHFNVAGTETFMLNVVRASDRTQYHFDFLIFRPTENKYRDEAEDMGCNFYTLPPRRESPVRYLRSLNMFFKNHAKNYDAVHWCGGAISSIAPLYYANKYKITNIIVHSHSSSCSGIHTHLLHSLFRRFLPMCCTHFFACSTLSSEFFFGKREAIVIKNGIDLRKYKVNGDIRNECRKEMGIGREMLVIGHVGRYEEVKNHYFLIEIFNELLQKREDSILLLIGKGSLENNIKEKVKTMGFENKVLFMGERSDIDRCMQAMDCFVMPSLYEGLPFVLVEAQAAALPCLISDTINDDAVITPYAIKVSLSDKAEVWADKIMKLTANYNRTDTSRYLKEKGFSIEDTVRYLETIYSGNNIII